MRREEIRPSGRNGNEFPVLIVEVGSIFAPVMAEGHELELLALPWMKRMYYPEAPARIVRSRCIRLYCRTDTWRASTESSEMNV
jgi:hypothetical protein